MNWLNILVIILVSMSFLAVAIVMVISTRAKNKDLSDKESFAKAWIEIRPLLTDLFVELFEIYNIHDDGYEAIRDYAINYLSVMIDETDLLTDTEKSLLTKDLLLILLEPRLKELYDKKFV